MKRLILLVPFLAGCTLVDAYLMTKYDANEYKLAVEIRSDASRYKTECNDAMLSRANAQAIAQKTQLFEHYKIGRAHV